MIFFKKILIESLEKLKQEKEERRQQGVAGENAKSEYLSIGHDSEHYEPSYFDKGFKEKLHSILRNVYGIHPGQESTPPDLWASGPTIKMDEAKGEKLVSVRPMKDMGDTHSDVFSDAYQTDPNLGLRSHPHVYGRIDHVRKVISMQTNHSRHFSSNSLAKIREELKTRYPNYDIKDLINK
jgi:hypothetical protein